MKLKQLWLDWIKPILILLPVCCFGIWMALTTQMDFNIQFNETCNNLYGNNSWVLNDTTGTLKNGLGMTYIGQSWGCIAK
jgi:hypothetical protein